MVSANDESDFQPGFVIIFVKLKNKQSILIFKPINYIQEGTLADEDQFLFLSKENEIFSFDSESITSEMNENGQIEINDTVWSNLIENVVNKQDLGG